MGEMTINLEDMKLTLPTPKRDELGKEVWGRIPRIRDFIPANSGIDVQQFCLSVCAEANKLPPDTKPTTIAKSAFNAAMLGLIPGESLGHCYFVTFNMNKGKQNAHRACQLVIGYRGFIDLAYSVGFLKSIKCDVVLEDEEFERWNDETGARMKHKMPRRRDVKYSNVDLAYCIWHSNTGGSEITYVERSELDKLKRRGNVWDSDPIAMSMKTAARRAAKFWKISGRLGTAVALDEQADRDELQHSPVPLEDEPDPKDVDMNDFIGSLKPHELESTQ